MELRDFAEQILFATNLADKLKCPTVITDEKPGAPLAAPAAPGRPPELRIKPPGGESAEFPGLARLGQERERGRLLHFFANHELLATELMALVLLRFPDAPAAFRRGVLKTLQDEQMHTRLYLHRMAKCGVSFGELPVSGYFWRSVASMENPIDYVAGLSLTFEQANLDFCRSFARGFAAVGDEETSRLLERIYQDEIAHVAYGLKWFRRWKNPDASDWEAFCRQLKFPLSPSRAKGLTLNVEGRRAAGFDSEFIAELNVYSQSKGRTPSIFVFNPYEEGRISQGRTFTPAKHQQRLALDLANLPQFLGRKDDVVLVPKRPSVKFLDSLKLAGFPLPEFLELDSERSGSGAAGIQGLRERKIGRLRPWAWGPESAEMLAPLQESVTGETRSFQQRFNDGIAQFYSKAWSADFLRDFLRHWNSDGHELRSNDWLCTEDEVGVTVDTVPAAMAAIEAIRRRGHHRVLAKQAFGLAGQNAIRLWEPEILETQKRWLANSLENGHKLVIEPWLEREMDFSVQLEMTPNGLRLCGYAGLINSRQGQFQANWAEANYVTRMPARVATLFPEPSRVSSRLRQLYEHLFRSLEARLRDSDFLGPVGLDAFVYRTTSGECRLKPVVEMNPRYTMGRVMVELMQHVCPGSHGVFRLMTLAMTRAEGFDNLENYGSSLAKRFPSVLEGEPSSKIHSGAVCLNDPEQAQVVLAVLQVSRDLKELQIQESRS